MPSCNSVRPEGETSGAAEDAWHAKVLGYGGEKLLLPPASDSHLFVFDPAVRIKVGLSRAAPSHVPPVHIHINNT